MGHPSHAVTCSDGNIAWCCLSLSREQRFEAAKTLNRRVEAPVVVPALRDDQDLVQLVTAGVRVFFYLEDRERTLDSPTDKVLLSLTAFADELEREKARQRVTDSMSRHARAGM